MPILIGMIVVVFGLSIFLVMKDKLVWALLVSVPFVAITVFMFIFGKLSHGKGPGAAYGVGYAAFGLYFLLLVFYGILGIIAIIKKFTSK